MKSSLFRSLALTAALGLATFTSAHAVEYKSVDAAKSRITFGYSQMAVNMDGRFGEFRATEFSFDPGKPEDARVVIEVSLASIDAGYDEANGELAKEEWLNTKAYPLAVFKSGKVEVLGDGKYQVTGDLSIKGNTKQVTVPFTFAQQGDAGVFEGSFTMQRADFAVGEGQWKDFSIVANDVRIGFQVVALP